MASVVGAFVAISFIKFFTLPFEKWPGFKMGLIDKNGQKIRDAENNKEEKEFVSWKNLIRKLKIILNKVPLGPFGQRLASFAASFWLLKEELDAEGHEGDEIINIFYERLLEIYPEEVLSESNTSSTLTAGKYTINETSTLILIKEDQEPHGKIFGCYIFKVKDIVTNDIHYTTIQDMVRL